MKHTTITVQFSGITFNDPNWPVLDVNGQFGLSSVWAPTDRLCWELTSKPDANGISRFIRVIEGLAPDVYYQVVMSFIKKDTPGEMLVFSAQEANLPVTNTLQYGGTAEVTY